MNAHKIAIKAKRAYKASIKNERYWIKFCIKRSAEFNRTSSEHKIKYAENFEWLKEKGFKVTKKPDYNCIYIISWEGC